MTPVFNENRYGQLLSILAQGGFLDDYSELFRRYSSYGDFDNRPKLDFARTVSLFQISDPCVKALKKWRMIEFGTDTIGGWVWTGSLVIQRHDGLEPMMRGVSADGAETVGAGWMNLADGVCKMLPEPVRPSHEDFGRPRFDGSMLTMERMVPDLCSMFRQIKDLLRHGWSNQHEANLPVLEETNS